MSATEGGKRLAEDAAREEPAVAPGLAPLHGEDLEILSERSVLEAIVEHESVGAQALDGGAPRLVAALPHHHGQPGQLLGEEARLVARFPGPEPHTVAIRYHVHAARAPPVAAAQDGGICAKLTQRAGHESGERRLAAASEGDITDGDHGHRETSGRKDASSVAGRARQQGAAIRSRRRHENAAEHGAPLPVPHAVELELERACLSHGSAPRDGAPRAPWSA